MQRTLCFGPIQTQLILYEYCVGTVYKLDVIPTCTADEMSFLVPDLPQYECYQLLLLPAEIELINYMIVKLTELPTSEFKMIHRDF